MWFLFGTVAPREEEEGEDERKREGRVRMLRPCRRRHGDDEEECLATASTSAFAFCGGFSGDAEDRGRGREDGASSCPSIPGLARIASHHFTTSFVVTRRLDVCEAETGGDKDNEKKEEEEPQEAYVEPDAPSRRLRRRRCCFSVSRCS